MSLSFPKGAATLTSGKIHVPVRCNGSIAANCVGTLSVKLNAKTTKAVFSVAKGKQATLKVAAKGPAKTMTVTAHTEQISGGAVKTRRKLQLR